MRKWVLCLLLVISMLLPLGVHAQNLITFDSVRVQIWPEYDKPGVLIIYNLALPTSTALPADVSVRIPASAGEPNAVAFRQADGSLYSMDYTRKVEGVWAAIEFNTSSAEVQIEYYDPQITKDGNTRHYEYEWPGDYAVSQFVIQVQQPVNATDMRFSPSLGSPTQGNDGLTYYSQDIGAISADQAIRITVDYQKPDDTLSAENLPVQPSASIPPSTAPDLNASTWLPWILGILGAGLIVGGIFWFWKTGQQQRPRPQIRRKRSRAAASAGEAVTGAGGEAVYCSQCGKRASPGDQFCRSCGTKITSR